MKPLRPRPGEGLRLAPKPLIRLGFEPAGRALTESAQKSIVAAMHGLTTICGIIGREIIS